MVSDGSIELEVEQSDTVSLKNYKKTEAVRDLASLAEGAVAWKPVGLRHTFLSVVTCLKTYFLFSFNQQILERLSNLCVSSYGTPSVKNRKHEQRLLRNMGAHTVVLELLQIPYEKVNCKLESSDQLSI